MATQSTLSSRDMITQKHVLWGVIIFIAILCSALQFFVKPIFIIAGIVMIPALLYTMTRPYLGLLIYYFVMILRPAELAPALQAAGLERIVAGFVTVSFVLEALIRKRSVKIVNHPIIWVVGVFFLVQVLSMVTSLEATLTIEHVIEYLKKIVFVALVVLIVDSHERFRGLVWLHIVLMAYIAISALIAYNTGNVIVAQGITRIKSLTSAAGDPNSLSASMALTIPFVILVFRQERRAFLRGVLLFFLICMLYAIVVSGSRGGLLATITGFGLLWLISKRKTVTGVVTLLVAATLVLVMPDQYIARYSTIAEYAEGGEVDASSQERLDTWKAGIKMFADYPLMGVGAGAFGWAHAERYSPQFRRSSLKAHNMYVQLIAELGVVGLLAFCLLLRALFAENHRLRRSLRSAVAHERFYINVSLAITISMGVLMVYGVFAHSLYRFHWLLIAAFTIVIARLQRGAAKELHPDGSFAEYDEKVVR